jgi:hypothetical protein
MLCHYNHICTSESDMMTMEKRILSVSINKDYSLSSRMAATNGSNVHISYYLHNIKGFHLTRYIGQHKNRYILHKFACSLFNMTFILLTTVLLGCSCEKKCKQIGTTTEITYTLTIYHSHILCF